MTKTLLDTDPLGATTDGQGKFWNATTGKWEARDVTSGGGFKKIVDVTLTSNNDILDSGTFSLYKKLKVHIKIRRDNTGSYLTAACQFNDATAAGNKKHAYSSSNSGGSYDTFNDQDDIRKFVGDLYNEDADANGVDTGNVEFEINNNDICSGYGASFVSRTKSSISADKVQISSIFDFKFLFVDGTDGITRMRLNKANSDSKFAVGSRIEIYGMN